MDIFRYNFINEYLSYKDKIFSFIKQRQYSRFNRQYFVFVKKYYRFRRIVFWFQVYETDTTIYIKIHKYMSQIKIIIKSRVKSIRKKIKTQNGEKFQIMSKGYFLNIINIFIEH